MLQDWLICSLPTFLALPVEKGVWSLSVVFLSSSINLHLIKLFPVLLSSNSATAAAVDGRCLAKSKSSNSTLPTLNRNGCKLGQNEIALFVTAAQDFHGKLSAEQRVRFETAFEKSQPQLDSVYVVMLRSLCRGAAVGAGGSSAASGVPRNA